MVQIDFNNQGPESYDSFEEKFNELALKVFSHLSITDNFIIDVTIVDNNTIHLVNKNYRKIDRPTDVISFAYHDDEEEKKLINSQFPNPLGSIIISYEKAEEQAQSYGHSHIREMSFLFVHGCLHLLGYDHMTPDDEKEMFKLQDEILGGRKQ